MVQQPDLLVQETPAQRLEQAIVEFVRSSPENCLAKIDGSPIFEEPLVAFADGHDPLFLQYKTIIGDFHLTPREVMEHHFGPEAAQVGISVVSWVLPIARKTRMSNRRMSHRPSQRWSHTRWYGEHFNDQLRQHVVALLTNWGYRAVAPALSSLFHIVEHFGARISNWSERHVAYAAGLGTFSLNDGFITPKGIAMRCGSVVTDLSLPASPRNYSSHTANCRFYRGISCQVCAERCPAGAITAQGHDKTLCNRYMRETLRHLRGEYGVDIVGCGLCQTKVPCESRIPSARGSQASA
ncbi:MAG TPA: epoxyqueuosine reductase [Dehalococcoidia bacterium]|nr:epoxyqueuosine reductase [Dehalococcoidia bacterium]